MHVPDGFIDAPVSVATGVAAAAAVAVSLRGARRELGDAGGAGGSGGSVGSGGERTAPLAGLVAAFIFAVQMLNFPVAAGTSGHLLGGALAAILVGPYTGVLCVSVVLLMQGVLFADGGLTALGVNITDMAVVTTVVAYAVFRAILKLTPRRRRSVTVASFVAALISVPAAAVAFTAIYALGGTTHVSLGKVFTAMVGVHVLIGIGEAVITALTVSAVVSVRPDLVYGARGLTRMLEIRTAAVAVPTAVGAAGAVAAIPATVPGVAPEALPGGVAARAVELVPGATTGPAPSAARPAGADAGEAAGRAVGPGGETGTSATGRAAGAVAGMAPGAADAVVPAASGLAAASGASLGASAAQAGGAASGG
ncbi:energy-coupling factor ABC transporter permease, partial [Streptomyces sp. NPDC000941]